jgi:hypothetical protein
MRGRKIDTEFLTQFITECVEINKQTPEEIVNEAKSRVLEIDEQIKKVEELKKYRSKLSDVLIYFSSKDNKNNEKDKYILKFSQFKYPDICRFICSKKLPIDLKKLNTEAYPMQDIFFSVKQLLENNILKKSDNYLVVDTLYDDYFSYLNRKFND